MIESNTPIDATLLDRYLTGSCDQNDRSIVEAWVARTPANRAVVEALRQEKEGSVFPVPRAWARMTQRLGWEKLDAANPSVAAPRNRQWASVSVVIALCAILGFGLHRSRDAVPFRHSQPARRYATTSRQFARITLTDGSRVILGPNTVLTIPSDFGIRQRAIALSGEARFDMTPNPMFPISVSTGATVTRVIGTTFELHHYPHDRDGRIAVFAGKVSTVAGGASMTLTAGMTGQFTDSTVVRVPANDSTIITDWTRGRLICHNAPVLAVLATLRQWYGYEFRLTDSTLVTQHVSAVFTAGDEDEMFYVVAHMLGVTIDRVDSVVVLRPTTNGARSLRRDWLQRRNSLSSPTEVGR